jgi:hypothetical protein
VGGEIVGKPLVEQFQFLAERLWRHREPHSRMVNRVRIIDTAVIEAWKFQIVGFADSEPPRSSRETTSGLSC